MHTEWNRLVPSVFTRLIFWGNPMIHKGIEYNVTGTEIPGIWKWQFQIGDLVKAGKTEASLPLLAMRRGQFRIDRELKHAGPRIGSAVRQ
jgi:hypothetical protein